MKSSMVRPNLSKAVFIHTVTFILSSLVSLAFKSIKRSNLGKS